MSKPKAKINPIAVLIVVVLVAFAGAWLCGQMGPSIP